VDGFQVRQLVVVGVDAGAEEEAGVAPVDDAVCAELDEVGLVLLVAGGDEAVDLVGRLGGWISDVGRMERFECMCGMKCAVFGGGCWV